MAAHASLPEIEQRLVEDRGALIHSMDLLRQRMRDDVAALNPLRQAKVQVKRHPGATVAAAVVAGLIAGRMAGRLIAALLG